MQMNGIIHAISSRNTSSVNPIIRLISRRLPRRNLKVDRMLVVRVETVGNDLPKIGRLELRDKSSGPA